MTFQFFPLVAKYVSVPDLELRAMLLVLAEGSQKRDQSFPDSSVGKESTCNAGDISSISGSGKSAGEGISYPLQCSWASVVTQLVKNPPALRVTWVQSLGWVAIPFSRVFSQPKD